MVVAPGVYDGLTATLVARAGFAAAYMTGAGTSIAKGLPDYGLMTMTEMVANAGTIAAASGLPIVADADTGYGNELNMTRTVREFERAGRRSDPHRGSGLSEEVRASRRQGHHSSGRVPCQNPRRRCRQAGS